MDIIIKSSEPIRKNGRLRKRVLIECNRCHEEKNISNDYVHKIIKKGFYRCQKCYLETEATERLINLSKLPQTKKQKEHFEKNLLNRKITNEDRQKMSESNKRNWTPEKREHYSKMYTGSGNPNYNPNQEEVKMNKKLREICKTMLGNFLQGKCKTGKTRVVLGYDPNQFREHIESTWESWMNWDNYGHHYKPGEPKKWNIDHIKPIKKFADEGIFDPKIVNALSNLRAFDANGNFHKNAKYLNE